MKMADRLSVALHGALDRYRQTMTAADGGFLRLTLFVVRCSGAATAAWGVSVLLGLCEPVWAAISALVISQVRLDETQSCSIGRVLGTLLGIAVSLSVNVIGSKLHVPLPLQMALAVAICAVVTLDLPALRVALWTCPLILLASCSSAPLVKAAERRAVEVVFGALVGLALHLITEILADALVRRRTVNSDPSV